MVKESILDIKVKYNCKIQNKGLVGYYIEMKSLISEAKWAGYIDSESLSWVADKAENIGIRYEKSNVEDVELDEIDGEYKLPYDKEDENVFNIDIAFIKNVLSDLKKPLIEDNIINEESENSIKDAVLMESIVKIRKSEQNKIKEDPLDWYKLYENEQKLPEYKEEEIKDFLDFINDKIEKHNFDFGNLIISEIRDNLRIGDYFVFCDSKELEKTSIEVAYNKRYRLYIITASIKKENEILDDALTFICFIKEGKILKGSYLPYYGTKYKNIANLTYLKDNKYKVLQQGNKSKIEFDKLFCYEFTHVVWLGDKGSHLGYMKYYFNVKDFSFVIRLNSFGGFYKYGFTVS